MAETIEIENVPDALHCELVRRARARRQTLTRYLREVLEREVARLPANEIVESVAARAPVDLGSTAADLLRVERRERGLR